MGMAGADGAPGPIGERGEPGPVGDKGERGDPGPMGQVRAVRSYEDGTVYYEGDLVHHNGSTWQARSDTASTPGSVNWTLIAARGVDAPVGDVRGLYDPEGQYRKFDLVTLNGSEWRAKRDDPGPLPGEGWALSAQVGKRGEKGIPGERGERGYKGEAGLPGPAPVDMNWEGFTLVVSYSDGTTLAADATMNAFRHLRHHLALRL
jgi:hypothetical protein